MVLDGLKWFEAKNQKSMTINDKSAGGYLVLTLLKNRISAIFVQNVQIGTHDNKRKDATRSGDVWHHLS